MRKFTPLIVGLTICAVLVAHQNLQAAAPIAPVGRRPVQVPIPAPVHTPLIPIKRPTTTPTTVECALIGADGKPVAGATVMEAQGVMGVDLYPRPPNHFDLGLPVIMNLAGSIAPATIGFTMHVNHPHYSVVTDIDGKFKLPGAIAPTTVVVNDNRGYAEVHLDDLQDNGTVQLKAWGRIEGTLHVTGNGKIVPKVYITRLADQDGFYLNAVSHFNAVDVSPDGHFSIPRVAPGFFWVYTTVHDSNMYGPSTFVTIAEGSTTQVDIADHSRTVKGKVTPPAKAEEPISWKDSRHRTEATLVADSPGSIPLPNKWTFREPERSEAFYKWQQTPEAQKYNEMLVSPGAIVEADGSFEIFGVKPGKYRLKVNNGDIEPHAAMVDIVAAADVPIDVPANSTTPLDLGPIATTLQPGLRIKRPAPPLTLASLKSPRNQIRLSNYAGRFVVLCAWDAHFMENSFGLPTIDMKALQEEFGTNKQIVLVGISKDADPAKAQAYVTKSHLDHWIMASVPLEKGLPKEYRVGLTGAAIIGPDGKVLAIHLYGDQIATELRRLLAGRNGSSTRP